MVNDLSPYTNVKVNLQKANEGNKGKLGRKDITINQSKIFVSFASFVVK